LPITSAITLLLTTALLPSGWARGLAPYEPPAGCYIGAYIELDPTVKDDIALFERLTGKKHATYFRYVGYGQPFPFQWAEELRALGAMPHIAWEPNDGLDRVRDDEYLRGWAQACANYQGPIFLRFASEMNGDWEAWSGDPDLYIAKWRMVYDLIHRVAPNVIMVWCPFATPKSTIPLYYPGDQYVDWVGINVYSVVWHNGSTSRRAVDNALQHLAFAYGLYADRKPIAVCEYAATHYCEAEKAATTEFAIGQMRGMYEAIQTRFPRVKMINWFSVDAANEGLAHNDYALTTDPMVLQAYRTLIGSAHFLSAVVDGEGRVIAGGPGGGTGGGPAAGTLPQTSVPLALAEQAVPPADGVAVVVRGGHPGVLHGQVSIEAVFGHQVRPDRVYLYLDGRLRTATTTAPFSFALNADAATPGEHIVRAVGRDEGGGTLAETEAAVFIARPEG